MEPLVLVAERDLRTRELVTHFLRKAAFQVETAADGERALEMARELQPALLITEVLLPKLDGLALCRRVKADQRTMGIPVLVLSVLAVQVRASEAGASAFMLKPVSEDRLLTAIRQVSEATRHVEGSA